MQARDALPAAPRPLDALFTPGQRWSAALVIVLGVALAVAQPETRGSGFRFDTPPAAASPGTSLSPAGASTPAGAPDLGATVVPAPTSGSTEEFAEVVLPPEPPKVVALVRSGDGSAPGRDDAAIAAVFFETSPFEPTILTIPAEPEPAFCGQVAAAGPVAVMSLGVDQRLRDCLVGAGVLIVGFDTLGTATPGGGGAVVSTRRGVGAALDDLTAWAKRSDALAGKVGVVGTTVARAAVEGAVARMRSAGVDVAATAFVGDDATVGSGTSEGVRSFATAGVQRVIFAAPVAQQQRWAAQQSVISAGVSYVVADAYDAVVNEGYAPTFDGSIALTSVRVPWFARDNGEAQAQRECRTRWEAKTTPPTTLGSAELVKVFAWCQHVALLTAALEAYSSAGGTFADVLRSVRFTSPLTSDVGPLPGGRYGPMQDAVLVWQAGCGCWKQKTAFADRA